jgi:hypothetical protein
MHRLNVPPRCTSSLNSSADADAVRLTRLVPEAHVIGMADEACDLAYAFRAPSPMNGLAMPICALTGCWSSKLRPAQAAPAGASPTSKGIARAERSSKSVATMRRSLKAMRTQAVNFETSFDAI